MVGRPDPVESRLTQFWRHPLSAVCLVPGPLGVVLGVAVGFHLGWIGGSTLEMIALGIASILLAMLLAAISLVVKEFIGPMAVVYFTPILILGGAVSLIYLVYALSSVGR